MIDLDQDIAVKQLAELLDVTTGRVIQLVREGFVPREHERAIYRMRPSVHGYIRFLRERGGKPTSPVDLSRERARLARAQAERVEMQNKQARAELLPAEVIVEVFGQAGARIAGVLDGIIPAVKRRGGLTPAGLAVLETEVLRARQIAAGMSLEDLKLPEPVEDDVETPAEVDPVMDPTPVIPRKRGRPRKVARIEQ